MGFDLSSLKKAVSSFNGALGVALSEQISAMDDNLKNTVRARVIQNFEFTYHTYNERTAGDVFEVAKRFLQDAKNLLKVLEEKNDQCNETGYKKH